MTFVRSAVVEILTKLDVGNFLGDRVYGLTVTLNKTYDERNELGFLDSNGKFNGTTRKEANSLAWTLSDGRLTYGFISLPITVVSTQYGQNSGNPRKAKSAANRTSYTCEGIDSLLKIDETYFPEEGDRKIVE
ncbi:hypothetical protein V1477_014368 [Vespula maculifrons]|uniref:Uncharacterized protein n=1 Tax=Vespula maculifrons TaxID=7453 RepID=A0ABD2BKU4_VESMC